MEKRWIINPADPEIVNKLQSDLHISPVLCWVLAARGIRDFEEARAFFRPALADLHSPWLMKDMDLATNRLIQAFKKREKILVYGDYDVDGTTSVACMYQFLCRIYEHDKLDFYIPHRYKEGYGISAEGIQYAAEHQFTCIVALDCGIKSAELVSHASSLGIDFIICDHHLPGNNLPKATAILNPKQQNCPYPYKDLCGCGIGFKLICALTEKLELPAAEAFIYLDLVATAIAADIVPMTGENRVLTYFGLKKANEQPSPGIKALADLSGLQKKMTINNLVFMIAPRVNAAGRMDDARKAVLLFIEKDPIKARVIAAQLHSDNTDRREADSSITVEALQMLKTNPTWTEKKSTVLFQPHWHKGVIGIVASRLIEHFYRPTIILTQSGDVLAGSARSIPGFNIHEGLHQCRDLLIGFGGHYFAAGMTIHPDNIDAFAQRFEEVVSETLPEQYLIPEIRIDAKAGFRDLKPSFYNILSQMEPFGPDNMRPVFITTGVMDNGGSRIVKEDHIRFSVREGGVTFTGIGFNLAGKFSLLERRQPVDIVYTLEENEWNNQTSLQLRVIDLKSTGQDAGPALT
jgi:single-stranded-DNA-specific exonuclease